MLKNSVFSKQKNLIFQDFSSGGLEAQPGPGRAGEVAGQPAGFPGRAKPAPTPMPLQRLVQALRKKGYCWMFITKLVFVRIFT